MAVARRAARMTLKEEKLEKILEKSKWQTYYFHHFVELVARDKRKLSRGNEYSYL